MGKKILVTGGAGYIGSQTVAALVSLGYDVVVFDNLVYGHRKAIRRPLVKGSLLNKKEVEEVFDKEKFDGVIHFAAYALAGESMKVPGKYFENNILGGVNLLESMVKHGVDNIVFSSTCAIYGYPKKLPVSEDEEKKPVSVYGESKLMFEKVLEWYGTIFGVKNICLRYFNAAGASLDGSMGEDHDPETHIIPLVMRATGERRKFTLFGDDYNTKDGSCVRDYVHVLDLADAHVKALEYLFEKKESNFFNVGTGKGYSNKEIIKAVEKVVGRKIEVEIGQRREGDPDQIYADNSKIKKILRWKPKYSDIDTIVESAWKWYKKHPKGYKK